MKISEVLDRIKVQLDTNQPIRRTSGRHYMLFEYDVVFDGSSFIQSTLEDSLCHDSYKNLLVYFPNMKRYNNIVVPENDKTEMFNFLISNNLSTDNIETMHRLLKIYYT